MVLSLPLLTGLTEACVALGICMTTKRSGSFYLVPATGTFAVCEVFSYYIPNGHINAGRHANTY